MLGVAGHLLSDDYRRRLESIEYHTAVCLLLEIDRQFSPYYWTNIADPQVEFVGLVEHTNFVEPERYGGRRFLYLANYVEPGHELLALDADALLARYEPSLRASIPRSTAPGSATAGSSASPPRSRSSPSATSA